MAMFAESAAPHAESTDTSSASSAATAMPLAKRIRAKGATRA
jgi:hypothetical protein